jgi:hypothetical protein
MIVDVGHESGGHGGSFIMMHFAAEEKLHSEGMSCE